MYLYIIYIYNMCSHVPSIQRLFRAHINGSIVVHGDDPVVEELKNLQSNNMIRIHTTLTCTMTPETMDLVLSYAEHELVSKVTRLLTGMSRGKNTPQRSNTEIVYLLHIVGQNIKARRIQAHQSDAAAALVAYFEHAKIPENYKYHAWDDVLKSLAPYAHQNKSCDGRSNVFFDKDADSESFSDDE